MRRAQIYDATAMFAPDIMLAVQLERPKPMTPEARLMAAILEDAIHLLHKAALLRSEDTTRYIGPTQAWIRDDDEDWPCSFRNVCVVLNLNPDSVRDALEEKGLL